MSETDEAKRTIEAWAEAKGMLPADIRTGDGPPHPNPDYWRFAGARALRGWADGELVTEEDFDSAVVEQAEQTIR